MRIGSLFSGAGGLDQAVETVFGAETVWHCEVDPAASKVLAHRWPGVPNLGDITQVNWATMESVDILCGGFPCQDVSAAGKRAGIRAGTRSGLWAVFADVIESLRPCYVVIENVRGLLSATAHRAMESGPSALGDGGAEPVLRAVGAVLGDLSDLGYDAQWATVPASAIGAPHRRERVFILATDAEGERRPGRNQSWPHMVDDRPEFAHAGAYGGTIADPTRDGRHKGRPESAGIVGGHDVAVGGDGPVDLLPTPCARDFKDATASPGAVGRNTPSLGAVEFYLPTPTASDTSKHSGQNPEKRVGHTVRLTDVAEHLSEYGNSALLPTPRRSDGDGGANPLSRAERMVETRVIRLGQQWGKYEPAIRRWEALTRPAPPPTEPNTKGNPRLNPQFSEWLMGWPAGWVTQVEGLKRNDQLRIIGNGVVPQQAVAALTWLLHVAEVAA